RARRRRVRVRWTIRIVTANVVTRAIGIDGTIVARRVRLRRTVCVALRFTCCLLLLFLLLPFLLVLLFSTLILWRTVLLPIRAAALREARSRESSAQAQRRQPFHALEFCLHRLPIASLSPYIVRVALEPTPLPVPASLSSSSSEACDKSESGAKLEITS